jgi:hypothetical protein
MVTKHKDKDKKPAIGSKGPHHDPTVEHTPIIITDGSLAIEFAEVKHYALIPHTNINEANDLKLAFVQPHKLKADGSFEDVAHSDGSIFCRQFSGSDVCRILVTEQGNRGFRIDGFADKAPVTIEFDHGTYEQNDTDFPQILKGQRFGNKNSKVQKLLIFVNSQQVHDCELAGQKGILYEVKDPETT